MVETTVTQRAFSFIVSDDSRIGKPGAIFSAVVNIRQTSRAGIPPDCSPGGEVGTRNVYTVFPAPMISCHCVFWSSRRGNQHLSLQKCANLVIARTD